MRDPARAEQHRDLALALAMIAVSGLTVAGAWGQRPSPYDPIGAVGVPIATAIAIALLAGSILVRLALGRWRSASAAPMLVSTSAVDGSYAVRPGLTWGTIALALAYAAALPLAGFRLATVALLAALGWLLCDRSPRALAIVAAIALLGGIGLDWGFRRLLVDLP